MKKIFSIFYLVALISFFNHAEILAQKLKFSAAEKIVEGIQPTSFPDQTFLITDHGGRGDGNFDNYDIINRLIHTCSGKGGGIVVIPAGVFYCAGAINLRNNVNLHLEEGAVLMFSPEPRDYLPSVFTRWEGVELFNYSPLIYTVGQQNVAITGTGTINGNGDAIWTGFRNKQKPAQSRLRVMGSTELPLQNRVFGAGDYLRTPLIQFVSCERILVEGVTLTNSPFWILQPVYSSHIIIRDVNFHSMVINNDGIDLDSSTDALIENCSFRTGDDAVVFKSGRDQDAWRVNKPTKRVVVRNCEAPQVLHGLAFGSEMSGGVEEIYIENFKMDQVKSEAIQFKANKDRGGYIRNIFIRNILVDSAKQHLIYFTNDYHGYRGGNFPSSFSNIRIEDVNCNYARYAFQLQGLEDQPLENLYFQDILVQDAQDVFDKKDYFKEVVFKNVEVEGELIKLEPSSNVK